MMRKTKRFLAVVTAAVMAAGMASGCSAPAEKAQTEAAGEESAQSAGESAGAGTADSAGGAQAGESGGEKVSEESGSAAASGDLEPATVILDYVANTNHTGMYVALDQGYYEDQGLDVTIVEPTEGATATLIAVGKGDFGISYQEDVTMALASKEPLPIKAIAAIIQHNTSGFATYKDKNITSVKDFEGKTYAGWGGPGEEAVLRALMTENGADFSKLNMVVSDGSGFAALKDKVDIMWFFEAWDNVKCQLADFPINYMPVRDLDERLDYYTPVIITNDKLISENPEKIRKFLAATAKGYEFAMEKPDEAAQILQKYAPDYDMEMLKVSQNYLADKYMEDADRWGEMKDSTWDNYTEFMTENGVITDPVPAADCYTNEFLPE